MYLDQPRQGCAFAQVHVTKSHSPPSHTVYNRSYVATGREIVFNCSLSLSLPREGNGGSGSGPAGPIGPSHPAAAWRPRRWTWACSRSWGWGTGEASASASVSSVRPPSPAATARPSSPSRSRRDCWSCNDPGRGEMGSWETFPALLPKGPLQEGARLPHHRLVPQM